MTRWPIGNASADGIEPITSGRGRCDAMRLLVQASRYDASRLSTSFKSTQNAISANDRAVNQTVCCIDDGISQPVGVIIILE